MLQLTASKQSNWRRGFFRLWMVLSAAWVLIVVIAMFPSQVKPPFGGESKILVKFSDHETWEYSVDWGVEKIRADLQVRVGERERSEKQWAATLSETRKAECDLVPDTTRFDAMPHDCMKLKLTRLSVLAVPTGWENDQKFQQRSLFDALVMTLPTALGVPLVVLILGFASAWVVAGFQLRS